MRQNIVKEYISFPFTEQATVIAKHVYLLATKYIRFNVVQQLLKTPRKIINIHLLFFFVFFFEFMMIQYKKMWIVHEHLR